MATETSFENILFFDSLSMSYITTELFAWNSVRNWLIQTFFSGLIWWHNIQKNLSYERLAGNKRYSTCTILEISFLSILKNKADFSNYFQFTFIFRQAHCFISICLEMVSNCVKTSENLTLDANLDKDLAISIKCHHHFQDLAR